MRNPLKVVAPVSRPAVARVSRPAQALFTIAMMAVIASPSRLSAQQSKPWEQIPVPTLHEFHPQQPKRI
jgi:hypothetical protein